SELCYALGRALDLLLDASGRADLATQLGAYLRGVGPRLVLLDNFEQLTRQAAETVEVWRAMAPEVTFLVTSRQALCLPEEWVLKLEALPVPARGETSRQALEGSEAVQLFLAWAEGLCYGDIDLERQGADLAEVVRCLDGLPLALQLAAARLEILPL